MRLVTWNVNSLKVRMPRVEEWLADDTFPSLAFHALGYESAHHGEGRWNGVAILSRIGLDDVVAGFADGGPLDAEARVLSATCGGIRFTSVYVPNGRALDNEQYQYKLAWLERLRAHAKTMGDGPRAICGDYNIAPADDDVYDPAKYVGETHVSEPERSAFTALLDDGLVDVFRSRWSDPKLFSWWDYRAGDFHNHRGMRIDHILASKELADRCTWAVIDRNARKGTQPSDHAPLLADFDL